MEATANISATARHSVRVLRPPTTPAAARHKETGRVGGRAGREGREAAATGAAGSHRTLTGDNCGRAGDCLVGTACADVCRRLAGILEQRPAAGCSPGGSGGAARCLPGGQGAQRHARTTSPQYLLQRHTCHGRLGQPMPTKDKGTFCGKAGCLGGGRNEVLCNVTPHRGSTGKESTRSNHPLPARICQPFPCSTNLRCPATWQFRNKVDRRLQAPRRPAAFTILMDSSRQHHRV